MADLDAPHRRAGERWHGQFLPLMYYRSTLNGDGALGPIHNDLFPDIHPIGVQAYVEQEGL